MCTFLPFCSVTNRGAWQQLSSCPEHFLLNPFCDCGRKGLRFWVKHIIRFMAQHVTLHRHRWHVMDVFPLAASQFKTEWQRGKFSALLFAQCPGKKKKGESIMFWVNKQFRFTGETRCDAVVSVCLCSHTGQPYGRGGRARPAGDHSQHASLCGLSVRQPISASAPDGVCRDGRKWTEPTNTHAHTHTKLHLQKQEKGEVKMEALVFTRQAGYDWTDDLTAGSRQVV